VAFEEHPSYREILSARALGPLVGLCDPHYRVHEGRAGARTRLNGRNLVNFASYDYLGLNGHPEILAAQAEAAVQYGTSVSGSRLTSGERPVHRALEDALARVYRSEAGVVFVSGHATAASVLQALLSPKDLVLHDELIHNCVMVGAESVRCQRKSYRHNDLVDLDLYLTRNRSQFENVLIVTEGLFSMDGDGCDLARLVEIKEKHGAWLMMDEAHALGVLGSTGRGIAEHCGVDPRSVDIWYGTLSKTLVGCGGYVCGSQALIDILKMRAPGLVFSVGMPAPAAAASLKALSLMRREPERVERLQSNSRRFWDGARARGFDLGTSWGTAIVPIIVGSDLATLRAAYALEARGVYAFPVLEGGGGVRQGTSRLRFFISASHTDEDIDGALTAMEGILAPA